MVACQKSVELVEATRHRMKLLAASEMPFAEECRPVAVGLQTIRNRGFTQRQSNIHVGGGSFQRVELVTEPLLVTTRQQTGPSRAAVGAADIGIGEVDSARGQRIDVRRGNVLTPVDTDIRVTHIVGDDDNNIRKSTLLLGRSATKAQ